MQYENIYADTTRQQRDTQQGIKTRSIRKSNKRITKALRIIAIISFASWAMIIGEKNPSYSAQPVKCELPDWYNATGEKTGQVDPDTGECVPDGCVSSDYEPKKCEGFGPTKDGISQETLTCKANYTFVNGECVETKPPITDPDPTDEVDPSFNLCPDGSISSDGNCVIVDPPEIEEVIPNPNICPTGFTLTNGKCVADPTIKPILPTDQGNTCYTENNSTLSVKLAEQCNIPGTDGGNPLANRRNTFYVPKDSTLNLETGNLTFTNINLLAAENGKIITNTVGAFGIDAQNDADGLGIKLIERSMLDLPFVRLSESIDLLSVSAGSRVNIGTDLSFRAGADTFINNGYSVIGSLEMGDGNDFVQNLGSLRVKGNINLGNGDDTMITNAILKVDGAIDGGAGNDTLGFFSVSKRLRSFPAAKITNVETAVQLDGAWVYYGDIQHIDKVEINNGLAVFFATKPALFKDLDLNNGRYALFLNKNDAAIQATGQVNWKSGQLILVVNENSEAAKNPEGRWKAISGTVQNSSELAKNITLVYGSDLIGNYKTEQFKGLGVPLSQPALFNVYLEEGSLNIMVERKTSEEVICIVDPSDCEGNKIEKELIPELVTDNPLNLPISIGKNELEKIIYSGLTPRNIDGPGRGMSSFNNLLADSVFNRLPLRVSLKNPKNFKGASIHKTTPASQKEITSLAKQYANRNGIRAWFRGFNGNDQESYRDELLNTPFRVSTSGGVSGIDLTLAKNLQAGGFITLGNLDLIYSNSTNGGGSWTANAIGWGIRADYWTDHLYLQTLFSQSNFNGKHKRKIEEIVNGIGGESAIADKSANSYGLAFRLGTPFEIGHVFIEPQLTGLWSLNYEQAYNERGAEPFNLKQFSRETKYAQTQLAIKIAFPFRFSENQQLLPLLRVGWIKDWNKTLSDQKIGYDFTSQEISIPSGNQATSGLTAECGIDYSISNQNGPSYKAYLRGGVDIWGGSRGTDFQISGGLTIQL